MQIKMIDGRTVDCTIQFLEKTCTWNVFTTQVVLKRFDQSQEIHSGSCIDLTVALELLINKLKEIK